MWPPLDVLCRYAPQQALVRVRRSAVARCSGHVSAPASGRCRLPGHSARSGGALASCLLRRPASGFLAEEIVVDVLSAEGVRPLCSLLLQHALHFRRKAGGRWLGTFQLIEVRGVELIERLQLKLRETAIVFLLVPISPIGDLLLIRELLDLGLFLALALLQKQRIDLRLYRDARAFDFG